jgi:hypothetical protein
MNGFYTFKLGGIPLCRHFTLPQTEIAHSITLAPLMHAFESGVLLIEIPPFNLRTKTYWVELHDRSLWDKAIPNTRLAVHESRPGDGAGYVLEINGRQSLYAPGEPAFVTPDGSIGIHLAEKNELNVTVRIWEFRNPEIQDVIVSSILSDPPGDEARGENVVIRNDRLTSVNLSNWCLRDDRNHSNQRPWRFIFPNISLPPGENITIWTGRGANNRYNLYWGLSHAVWNNRGDTAVLLDNNGVEISRLSY